MSHASYLRELLRPLGVYDLSALFNGGELDAQGEALDQCMDYLEEIQQESSLVTAQDWGLEHIARLLVRRPVATDPRAMGAALAALLRIGGDSFTLEAINDTISGCGVPALVKELGVGQVAVFFPGIAGEPPSFQELKVIIEDILPAHLGIVYKFWFITWEELEEKFPTWQSIEDKRLSWNDLETSVD